MSDQHLTDWVGRERVVEDELSLSKARAMAATLDLDPASLERGMPLPHGWHWIYFNPLARASALGPDGHEKRGGFLPPVPLPRRMWAGGRIRFQGRLHIGEAVTRTSTILSVKEKDGRTGHLVFVTVGHRVHGPSGLAIDEEQDLVYRTPTPPGAGGGGGQAPALPVGDWSESVSADEVTLFRFSALTFNGHRIHYDHPYTTDVEGYPGLVVHGPLIALRLLEAGVRHAGGRASMFRYRAMSPLFCGERFRLVGVAGAEGAGSEPSADRSTDGSNLWAIHDERGIAMEALLLP